MTTNRELATVSKIVERAYTIDQKIDKLSLLMDISTVHETNPIRLTELLEADDFNFTHDVFGIQRNLNRSTKKLENCFSPRFTKV
jgi:hypothetical protein